MPGMQYEVMATAAHASGLRVQTQHRACCTRDETR